MTLVGSKNVTEDELRQALRLPKPVSHGEVGCALKKYWEASNGVELKSANRMFLLRSANIQDAFTTELTKSYAAQCESGRSTIHMIASASGAWANEFPVARTKVGPFRKHDGSTYELPMMSGSFHFPYAELEDVAAQALKLPFQGNSSLEMLIVLPFGNDGLPEVQAYLKTPENLAKLFSVEYNEQKVTVILPKFKLSKCPMIDAVQMLKEMGVHKLFDPSSCDLSAISNDMQLFVSGIFHQAVLEVDEKGATAVAATAIRVTNRALIREPVFKVDRPFFVAIVRDKHVPVFLGHVWEPETF